MTDPKFLDDAPPASPMTHGAEPMIWTLPGPAQCQARVLKRDTYRVDSGNRRRFKMHYNACRCSRSAVDGDTLCRQHGAVRDRGGYLVLFS